MPCGSAFAWTAHSPRSWRYCCLKNLRPSHRHLWGLTPPRSHSVVAKPKDDASSAIAAWISANYPDGESGIVYALTRCVLLACLPLATACW